jgi:putative endonuclease
MSYKYSYVYILSDNENNKLYIGVTSNLINRVLQHKQKLVDGYTKRYGLNKLVYFEEFLDINTAIKREKQLKGRLRIRKIKLIESKNPGWQDLFYTISDSS